MASNGPNQKRVSNLVAYDDFCFVRLIYKSFDQHGAFTNARKKN